MVELYEVEDTEVRYHTDDPDLPETIIKLPSLESFYDLPREEALKKVDGYGLHPKDQHFERYRELGHYKLPGKLKDLPDVVRKKLRKKDSDPVHPHELFDELESDPIYYADEISWIEEQILRSEHGHWVFIKGKPTFLDGIHYTYLLCWPINNRYRKDRLPFYRDVDRRIFMYFKWAYTTKSAYFKYVLTYKHKNGEINNLFFNNYQAAERKGKELGGAYIIEDWNDMVEMPYRTIFGVVFPKRRRIGGTSQASFFCLMITLRRSMGIFAIQALTEDTARDDVYKKKILTPYQHFWFFFKPASNPHAAKHLSLSPINLSVLDGDTPPHGGHVVPRSSENKAFDGLELTAYLNDESGKKKEGNILHEFRDTIKNTLAYGPNIHGFAIYVSTFGDFEKGGGSQFFEMCRRSFADNRNDLGQTQSGLATLFIPAFDGYDNCIDIYGASVIDDPDEPYITLESYADNKNKGKKIELQYYGAKSILTASRRHLQQNKDWPGLNNEVRNNPWNLRDANVRKTSGETWNTAELTEQIAELECSTPRVRRVNLHWSDGLSIRQRKHRDGITVVVEDAPDTGNFYISLLPPEQVRSLCQYDAHMGAWCPSPDHTGKFVLGVDPYKYGERDAISSIKKLSKGGGVMKYKRDYVIDPDDKPVSEWESNRIVCHYLHRPPEPEEYCEDMLKLSVLFNAMCCTERNVSVVMDKWRDWGFEGYLMYLISPATQQPEKVPGIHTGPHTHQRGFGLIQTHLKFNVKREVHLEVLKQVLDCEGPDDVTNNDLFAAWEMAEIGIENSLSDAINDMKKSKVFQVLRFYD